MIQGDKFLVAGLVLLYGCTPRVLSDYHVVKEGREYHATIANPRQWALEQFADGPIAGTNISNWARTVLTSGLAEVESDIDDDGRPELLIRQDEPARSWEVLVFAPSHGGYRFVGDFPARLVVPQRDKSGTIVVYEPCGGHFGFIRKYVFNGRRITCISTESLTAGDGAPDENNTRLGVLVTNDLKWTRTPNQVPEDTARKFADPPH